MQADSLLRSRARGARRTCRLPPDPTAPTSDSQHHPCQTRTSQTVRVCDDGGDGTRMKTMRILLSVAQPKQLGS
eukprot:2284374-Rhodomonas_salina.3